MRSLLCLASLALVAQQPAPLDLKAVQAEMKLAGQSVQKAFQAHMKGGGKREDFKPDAAKASEGLRAKAAAAKGVQREAFQVGEIALGLNFRAPKETLAALLKQIPAASEGWMVAADALPQLAEVLGPEGEAYVKQVAEKGFPGVKAELKASQMEELLETGKVEEAKALVAELRKDFPTEEATKRAVETFDVESKLAVGADAPDFAMPDMEKPGQTLTKASFKGKYVLLDFWGTWCGWCVKDLPHTHNVYAKHKEKLEILSLASDPSAEVVNAFRKKPGFPMPWKHTLLTKESVITKAYAVKGFPTLYLIGPDGKIVAKGMDLRMEKFEPTMDRILGK